MPCLYTINIEIPMLLINKSEMPNLRVATILIINFDLASLQKLKNSLAQRHKISQKLDFLFLIQQISVIDFQVL